jgi:hypothetical protein
LSVGLAELVRLVRVARRVEAALLVDWVQVAPLLLEVRRGLGVQVEPLILKERRGLGVQVAPFV